MKDYNPKRDFVGWGSAEGTVIANDKRGLVVRVGSKERAIPRSASLLDRKGKALQEEQAVKVLRPGVRVEITERGGKVAEVRIP